MLLDNRRVNACLVLAVSADGAAVTTVESLAPVPDPVDAAGLHPVQAAFLDHERLPVRLLHAWADLLRGRRAAGMAARHPSWGCTAVATPACPTTKSATWFAGNSHCLKARDRRSYAYALVSVAAGLELRDEVVAEAEAALVGRVPGPDGFEEAAAILLRGAQGYAHNGFKLPLAARCVVRALTLAAEGRRSRPA